MSIESKIPIAFWRGVMASGDATAETIQFAKSLGVELILDKEIGHLSVARTFREIEYANYGILMKILLYHYTKDRKTT